MFIDEHSWLHWWSKKDIGIMADTGTSVAHCPTPFARYGHTLEHFGKYRQAGVNLGIGTDTVPQNLIEEMRWATGARADRRRGHPLRPRWPTSSTPPPRAARAPSCARISAGSPLAPRRISCSWT
jgi:hypothetical protein